ncbi:MAG: HAD-IIB family hydrolase [Lachnospiraceae bacterium]
MKKAIFFDADGTLIDIQKGMTEETKRSLLELKENGHELFLCTGRGRSFLSDELEHIPFTGMICSMGAYIEINGKKVFSKEIPLDIGKYSVEILRKNKMVPVLEGASYMYYDLEEYTTEIDWFADLITAQLGNRHKQIRGNEEELHFSKISAKHNSRSNIESACSQLSEFYNFIYHEGAFVGRTVEMIVKGCSKGVACAVICSVLGIDKKDTIAFGDSNNDIELFDACGFKIAMGDASIRLKSSADLITSNREREGITIALRKLNLIG